MIATAPPAAPPAIAAVFDFAGDGSGVEGTSELPVGTAGEGDPVVVVPEDVGCDGDVWLAAEAINFPRLSLSQIGYKALMSH